MTQGSTWISWLCWRETEIWPPRDPGERVYLVLEYPGWVDQKQRYGHQETQGRGCTWYLNILTGLMRNRNMATRRPRGQDEPGTWISWLGWSETEVWPPRDPGERIYLVLEYPDWVDEKQKNGHQETQGRGPTWYLNILTGLMRNRSMATKRPRGEARAGKLKYFSFINSTTYSTLKMYH